MDTQAILDQLTQCTTKLALQDFHAQFLWKKWIITERYKTLKSLSDEEKKVQAQAIQIQAQTVENAFAAQQDQVITALINEQLAQDPIDASLPGMKPVLWGEWLLLQLQTEVQDLFARMGFHIVTGNHVVNQFANFTSLNIPETHPAREMHDTFYLQNKDADGNHLVMRTHTTAIDNEMIQQLGVPCKFCIVDKVYRNENLDASHDCVFWQIDGVIIDKDIGMPQFKHIMHTILTGLLGENVRMRMRPGYFPFVEPGIEIEARHKVGKHEKRLEILGAWLLHPDVLRHAGVDPDVYTGIAFGMGMTRLAAIKYGIHDVRLFTNGDLRFAQSWNT